MRRLAIATTLTGAILLAAGAAPSQAGEPENSGEWGGTALRLRWLGIAGFSIWDEDDVVLQDPFFTRPGLLATVFGDYLPDAERIRGVLAADGPAPETGRARLIAVGHSHYDHLGDAPFIALETGGRLAGSRTSANIARGYDLPEHLSSVADPGTWLQAGDFSVQVVESRHAEVILGRVPMVGTVDEPQTEPIHALSFMLGDARGHLVVHRPSGLRVYILSSAAVHEPALESVGDVDVLLAATQGRNARYVPALIEHLRPKLVIPHHYDSFFTALDAEDADAPTDPDDLAAFEAEVAEAAAALGHALEFRRLRLWEVVELEAP